jgi:hypothetical protein
LVTWLLGCLVAWLLGCLVAWLVGWLVGWLETVHLHVVLLLLPLLMLVRMSILSPATSSSLSPSLLLYPSFSRARPAPGSPAAGERAERGASGESAQQNQRTAEAPGNDDTRNCWKFDTRHELLLRYRDAHAHHVHVFSPSSSLLSFCWRLHVYVCHSGFVVRCGLCCVGWGGVTCLHV